MELTLRGANDIIAPRTAAHSGRFVDYWDQGPASFPLL